VLSAEEILYDDGSVEVRVVLDAGLGQSRALAVCHQKKDQSHLKWLFYSAEKATVHADRSRWGELIPALRSAGYSPVATRYGAPVIQVSMPSNVDILNGMGMLDSLVSGFGSVILQKHPACDAPYETDIADHSDDSMGSQIPIAELQPFSSEST